MPPFKPVFDRTGGDVEFEPVVVTLHLTPEQRTQIGRVEGTCPASLEFTASDLDLILRSRVDGSGGGNMVSLLAKRPKPAG
jgi:hypothetical protein